MKYGGFVMVWELGEILSRTGAGSQSFVPKTSPAHGAMTPSDIAAALASVRSRPASLLVQAKYIDHNPKCFDVRILIRHYQYANNHRMRRVDTVRKLANAALRFYVNEPRCLRCRGHAQEWDKKKLRFVACTSCGGMGGRNPSMREISRLSNMSRSKLKRSHINCFWNMYQILSIWEAGAAAQIRKALRR